MKKIVLFASVLLLTATVSFAQSSCDKKVVYHSTKQETLNPEGEVTDNKSDVADIEVSKDAIAVSVNDQGVKMTGTVKEVSCEWKTPYQEGKVVYKVTFAKGNGETSEGSLTIEAKGGKLTALFFIEAMDGRKLRALIDNYTEK